MQYMYYWLTCQNLVLITFSSNEGSYEPEHRYMQVNDCITDKGD